MKALTSRRSFLAAVVTVIVVLAGCNNQQSAPTAPTNEAQSKQMQMVKFHTPRTFDDLASIVDSKGISVEEIRMEFPTFTAGYTVAGRPLATIREDFFAQHSQFVVFMADDAQPSEGQSFDRRQFIEMKAKAEALNIPITAITVHSSDANTLGTVFGADIVDVCGPPATDEKAQPPPSDGVKIESLRHEPWAPYEGMSSVNQGQCYQSFSFNDVSIFYNGSTYEHETQIYNVNYVDYANYWASNMPSPYIDTGFWDDPGLENYTIGTFRAHLLNTTTRYYVYLAFRAGSQNSAICRVKGQFGYRNPTWCYSTWCVWPIMTTQSMATLSLPVQGVRWTY